MGFLHLAMGHLNRMFGDPQFLRDHREDLLALYRPSAPEPDAATDGLLSSTEQMLGSDSPLGEAVAGLDPSQVSRILKAQPPTIIEAQRAVVHRNLQRAEPYGMTFAWLPGYDYEVNVSESPPSGGAPGWITVIIKSRYPGDAHPVKGG
jgi:hypothetical protein